MTDGKRPKIKPDTKQADWLALYWDARVGRDLNSFPRLCSDFWEE